VTARNPAPAPAARAPVASMTGFARADGVAGGQAWTVEAKSVNGRGLDVRCRFPSGLDALEPAARGLAAKHLKRGTVSIGVQLSRAAEAGRLRLNREVLAEVLRIAAEIEGAGAARPRIDALLAVRGVIETADDGAASEDDRAGLEAALAEGLERAVAGLAEVRAAEGRHLEAVIAGHLDAIERLTAEAAASAAARPEALRARFRAQLDEILQAAAGVPEERLAQELAVLVSRGDVREELDRLSAHVAQARELMAEGGAVGRRLDFLCQEFNREANTLCSKSQDVALTRIGLELKAAIEQLREQVQNVE